MQITGEIISVHSHPGTYFLELRTPRGREIRLAVSDPDAVDNDDLADRIRQRLGKVVQGIVVTATVAGIADQVDARPSDLAVAGTTDNPIVQALEAAARHEGNPAVDALVAKLDVHRRLEKAMRQEPRDPLAGWRRGVDGADRFGLMFAMDPSAIKDTLQGMTALHEIAVITSCLVDVLNALGEQIIL